MRIDGNSNLYSYTRIKEDPQVRAERLAKLKQQISTDNFNPDPQEVAKKILASPEARRQLGFEVRA